MRETSWLRLQQAATLLICNRVSISKNMKSQTNMSEPSSWSVTIRSHGFVSDVLIAAPMGLLLLTLGISALVEHDSAFTVALAILVLMFGSLTLASCAYSLWGECFVSVESGKWSVTQSLWRWRRTASFFSSSVRSASLYKPTRASAFPGSSGWQIQVSLNRSERPFVIGEGMHAPEEELEPIRAMIEQEAHLS